MEGDHLMKSVAFEFTVPGAGDPGWRPGAGPVQAQDGQAGRQGGGGGRADEQAEL